MEELQKYKNKRNFNKTTEPNSTKKATHKKPIFVVQHHLATKDHYDLRLEYNGVLKSWAIPKGPSTNTQDKRLAIQVEDHPYDYHKFEGIIPKGEYGAKKDKDGIVMIWDEGTWSPLKNSHIDFKNGPIKFTLKGKRLKGSWSLIHFKDNNWLLIKEKEDTQEPIDLKKLNTSIKTGRTMKEIASDAQSTIEKVKITNPQKIIFNHPNITKIEIILYYQAISKRMLPYIQNRLISTLRAPNGLNSNLFFKKHLETKSSGIGMKKITNESGNKEDYYYIKNIHGLISEIQMNSYEIHTWCSSIKSINHPDIMVFDLDPDEKMNIQKVRNGVKDLKQILDELNLKSYLKTSGGKGYHVIVPIKQKTTWLKFRKIAKSIAELMVEKWPEKYTSNIRKEKRKNKIFIDWLRNTKGSTSIAPYSLRLRKNAPVSIPIFWHELDTIKPNEITIKKALKRLELDDPWADFFD